MNLSFLHSPLCLFLGSNLLHKSDSYETRIVQGQQGHAAYPQLADNPVPKLARIIDRLSSTSIDCGSDAFEPSRLQFTVISVPNTAAPATLTTFWYYCSFLPRCFSATTALLLPVPSQNT